MKIIPKEIRHEQGLLSCPIRNTLREKRVFPLFTSGFRPLEKSGPTEKSGNHVFQSVVTKNLTWHAKEKNSMPI